MAGVSMPTLLAANNKPKTSVILFWLSGGPSHIDMWDPKPDAPREIRSPFNSIPTKLPGVHVCEHLPLTAKLMDKLTILQIKSQRIDDDRKLSNVRRELELLERVYQDALGVSPEIADLSRQLTRVNEELWDIEDRIRECEQRQDFGPEFIELARSVYRTNDRRSVVKRRINKVTGARLMEEKHYAKYQ